MRQPRKRPSDAANSPANRTTTAGAPAPRRAATVRSGSGDRQAEVARTVRNIYDERQRRITEVEVRAPSSTPRDPRESER